MIAATNAGSNAGATAAAFFGVRRLLRSEIITNPFMHAAIVCGNEQGQRLPKSRMAGQFGRSPARNPYSLIGPMAQAEPPIPFRGDRITGALTALPTNPG